MQKENLGYIVLLLGAMGLAMCMNVWIASLVYYQWFGATLPGIAIGSAVIALLSLLFFPSGHRSHPLVFAAQVFAGMSATLIVVMVISEHIERPGAPLSSAEFSAVILAFPTALFFIVRSLAAPRQIEESRDVAEKLRDR